MKYNDILSTIYLVFLLAIFTLIYFQCYYVPKYEVDNSYEEISFYFQEGDMAYCFDTNGYLTRTYNISNFTEAEGLLNVDDGFFVWDENETYYYNMEGEMK